MESSSVNNQITEIFNSPRGRWRLAVIAAIALVAIAIWFNVPKTIETCDLIDGCRLKQNDLQRIQLALSQAGLNDFEIVECNVRVPKSQRDIYLRAVSEGKALPRDLAPREDETQSFNPLMSRRQQEQMQQAKKEKQVTEMVMRLPFVEQAWFEMDKAKSRSSFHEDEQAAVILIQPADELQLDFRQVETIRDLITGAIAGIDRESIVVTDLSVGLAIKSSNAQTGNLAGGSHEPMIQSVSTGNNKQVQYENRIRKALEDFEGIEVEVSVEQIETDEASVDLQASRPTRKPAVIQIGTNGQADVEEPKGISETSRKRTIEKVSATIRIPEKILVEHLPSEFRAVEATRRGYSYRAKLSEVKSEIVRRVREILPKSVWKDSEPLIEVEVIEQTEDQIATALPLPWYEQALEKVGGPLGGGAILVLGLLILAYVFSGSRKAAPPQVASPTVAEPTPTETEPAANNEQAIKQEISKLIHEDPEAAAKVIKRWIRNAA